jgi:hypothetical protein
MKKLLLASAIIAGSFAGQATAAIPLKGGFVDFSAATGLAKSGAVAKEIWMAGSSAATQFIEKSIIASSTGVVYKYKDADGKAFTYIFTAKAGVTGLTSGATYIVNKRDGGGSITGILAAAGTNAKFNNRTSTPSNALGAQTLTDACVLKDGITTCTTPALIALVAHDSDVKLSDVDAAQFASPLNGADATNALVTKALTVTSTPIAAQVFGIAVNLKLRDAMQVAMKAAGILPATCLSTAKETEACMPSLTSEQLATIWAKDRFTNWGNLRFGGTTGTDLVTAQSAANKPANLNVHMCSRTAGSGTLATLNVKFENAPCFSGNEAIQAPVTQTTVVEAGASGSKKLYHATTSTGNLENCLTALDSGTANSTFTPPSTFRWAIGVLGAEKNATNSKNYRFIKIDGVSPSAENVVKGKYKFWAELATVGTTSTDVLTTAIMNNVKNPTLIKLVNVDNLNFGVTGFLGVANNAAALPTYNSIIAPGTKINGAFDPLRPVSLYTHSGLAANSLNHCRAPTLVTGAKAMQGLN